MPFFFFVSGFFAPTTSKIDFISGFRQKTLSLLKPTFLYVIFFGILAYILCRLPYTDINEKWTFFEWLSPHKIFYDTLTFQPFQPLACPLWFVPSLWLGFLLWFIFRPLIEKADKSSKNRVVILVTLIFLYFCSISSGITLDKNRWIGLLNRTTYAFVFIALGYIAYQFRGKIFTRRWIWLIVLLAIFAIWWKCKHFYNLKGVDVRSMGMPKKFLLNSFLIVLSGTSLIFLTSYFLEKVNILKRIFCWLGKKSFHIMAIHSIGRWLFWWFERMFQLALPDNLTERSIGWLCFAFAMIFTIGSILVWDIIERSIKYRNRGADILLLPVNNHQKTSDSP